MCERELSVIESVVIDRGKFMAKDWPEVFIKVSGESIESRGFVLFHCL